MQSVLKFVCSLCYLVAAIGAVIGVSFVSYNRRVVNPQDQLLPDLFQQYWPYGVASSLWPNLMVALIIIFAIVLICAMMNDQRLILMLLGEYCVLLGTALFLRTITIFWTSYPDPDPSCAGADPNPTAADVIWYSCGSLMFSAHTSILLMSGFIIHEAVLVKRKKQWDWVVWFTIFACQVYVIAGALGVLAARLHWTADVIVAIENGYLVVIAYKWVDWKSLGFDFTENSAEEDYSNVSVHSRPKTTGQEINDSTY